MPYLPNLVELRELFVLEEDFKQVISSSTNSIAFQFGDEFLGLSYQLECFRNKDSLTLTFNNFLFSDPLLFQNNKQLLNYIADETSSLLNGKTFTISYFLSPHEVSAIKNLFPLKYDSINYIRCIDDSSSDFTINAEEELSSNWFVEEALSQSDIERYLKNILNTKVLMEGGTACIFNPHDAIVFYTKKRISFIIEICYGCGEIRFTNVRTGAEKQLLYFSENFNNDPLIAKMEKYNKGDCSKNYKDEMKMLEYKIRHLNFKMDKECR